ncbi:hypothetical protein KA517_04355 [Candidatus Gracilibacteria bacterium]|nr:hypothetical protein [Candidatus Gracilibacteria bacterium]
MSRRSDRVAQAKHPSDGRTTGKAFSTSSLDTAINAIAERLATEPSRIREALSKVLQPYINIYSIDVSAAERRDTEGFRVEMNIILVNVGYARKAPQERFELESTRPGKTPQVALL